MTSSAAVLGIFAASLACAQPPDAQAVLDAAMAAERAGKLDAAVRQFDAIVRSTAPPEVVGQARLELVRIHGRRAEWFQAAEQLQALRKLAPEDAEYAYELGVVYRNLSKSAFEHMQSVAPQSARVQQMLGEQYAAAGENERAIAAYQRAAAADPKLAGSHLALAVIYLRQQKREKARMEIEKELAITPESAVARQVRQAIEAGGR